MHNHTKLRLSVLSLVSLIAVTFFVATFRSAPAQNSKSSPKGAYPVAKAMAGQETATFAGGCFWSMDAIYQQLKGVVRVEPGYAGGALKNPSYNQVLTGQTGHSETINVIYNPKVISYYDLVKVFLTVHDPTTLDRQGADVGSQYRSRIFYRNDAQKKVALQVVGEVGKSSLYSSPIVTKLEPYTHFYRAEDYHLNYYNQNPTQGYCVAVVAPKIAKFRAKFKDKLKS